jgi:hypothetical protein
VVFPWLKPPAQDAPTQGVLESLLRFIDAQVIPCRAPSANAYRCIQLPHQNDTLLQQNDIPLQQDDIPLQ